MKFSSTLTLGALLGCLAFASAASAAMYFVDVDAPVVKLRISCTETPVTGTPVPLKNCFDTVKSLNDWVNGTRLPNVSKPLLVEIGPGNFTDAGLSIGSVSYITYRGSGQSTTTIGNRDMSSRPPLLPGLDCQDCTEINVENLTLVGGLWGAFWSGTGSSTWTNVTVRGNTYGWTEENCPDQTGGKHYWFASRVIADATGSDFPPGVAKGYLIFCGQSWFFGTEILAVGGNSSREHVKGLVVRNSEAHVYGGVIRAELVSGATVLSPGIVGGDGTGLVAAFADNNARLHIHGTEINVDGNSGVDANGKPLVNDIAALMAANGGEIHANGAAYNLKTGPGGKIHRIINGIIDANGVTTKKGHVHAPYLWGPNTRPPTYVDRTLPDISDNTLISAHGADMAVETDCAPALMGGCQKPGDETHLLIYNSGCTGAGGTWFDVATKKCR